MSVCLSVSNISGYYVRPENTATCLVVNKVEMFVVFSLKPMQHWPLDIMLIIYTCMHTQNYAHLHFVIQQ